MTTSQGGIETSPRSSLGTRTINKDTGNHKQPVGASTTSHESSIDNAASQQTRKDKINISLRRSSSKLLSLLRGFRNSSNGIKSLSPGSGSPLNPGKGGDGSRSSYPASTKDKSTSHHAVPSPQPSIPVASQSNTASRELSLVQAQEGNRYGASEDESPTQSTAVHGHVKLESHAQDRRLAAGLPVLLSEKVTKAFADSTVVRRSNISRPSIRDAQLPHVVKALSKQGDNAVDTSDSSTSSNRCSDLWSGRTSLTPNSTPPTSDKLPSGGPNSSSVSPNLNNEVIPQQNQQGRLFGHDQVLPNISPSIVTAEAVTNAKVFFETCFKTIFSHVEARSQRHYELEKCLYMLSFSSEDQMAIRRSWIRQEQEHLRQYRVLKALFHSIRGESSVGNYEVVKDLGRGSFGVVHLVRERSTTNSCISGENDYSTHERKRMDNARTKAMGSQKTAFDEGRPVSNQENSSGMRGVYAMKVIRKKEMLRTSQEGHLRAERDFLVASAQSRWVVPLIASFQDSENLYLVMEYMVGGDFLGLMMRHDVLPESVTRWYIAEMILCIEEAHKMLWIHRDIKPDNFLISASGHLKIGDFGLAFNGHWAHDQAYYNTHRYSMIRKLGIQIEGDFIDREEGYSKGSSKRSSKSGRTNSLSDLRDEAPKLGLLEWRDRHQRRNFASSVVGTSQYMAPEVVQGLSYDGRCDWWSIGIILYECLYGFTPFEADDRLKTKLKILNHHQMLRFPLRRLTDRFISADAIDLMSQLLQEKEYRLSARSYRLNDSISRGLFYFDTRFRDYRGMYVYPNDASDIKSHPFFRGIQWDIHGQSKPPTVPVVKSWEDTSYFDDGGYSCESDGKSPGQVELDDKVEVKPSTKVLPAAACPSPPGGEKQVGPRIDLTPSQAAKTQRAEMVRKAREERARDKILRDDQVGKKAMDMRKEGAFLGYTYRRPGPVALALNGERGRPLLSRRDLSDLYRC